MKKPLAVVRYLLSVHILALIVLFLFRITLYLVNLEQTANVENKPKLLFISILKGVQFDNMIACYAIVLPVVVLLILALCNRIPKAVIVGFNIYFIFYYAIIFAVSAADIPYFSYFSAHLGGSVLNWIGFGDTAGMILGETSYYAYFALYLVLTSLFGFLVFRFGKKLINSETTNLIKKDYKYYIPIIIIIWGLCFIGMRGRLGRYPLRVSGAYFCDNSFFNQLGVNPAFHLFKSTTSFMKKKDKLLGTINESDAIAYVQKALGINTVENKEYPITRKVVAEGEPLKANVVIILMESMSDGYLKREYNGKSLTPFLHELINKSYYFENFYSSGVNTNKGIASTLYGFPPMFLRTMMGIESDLYTGLPYTLQNMGYQTSFFLTHDPQYDNMQSFLSENGFSRIYSQYDYPNEKIVNNFGVQDDFLLEYGIKKLNERYKSDEPFFATFMTVSNHPPYIVPDKFKNMGASDEECIVTYADNCIKDFMANAAKEEWYKNTIFVLLGDHGRTMGVNPYDVNLTHLHIPLIIYSPLFENMPKKLEDYGGQIDIFPTIMGLLNRSYENNSLGIDLFKEKRPFIYMATDNHLGCIDDNFLYTYNTETRTDALFDYKTNNGTNLRSEHAATADSMKTYAISMMVTADYLVKNKRTRPSTVNK